VDPASTDPTGNSDSTGNSAFTEKNSENNLEDNFAQTGSTDQPSTAQNETIGTG
jgi:hypothetical protein